MRDIAREMNMEAASLYNHISSKQAVLSELLLRVAQEFTDGMSSIKKTQSSSIDKLEALVCLHVQMTVKYTDSISLIPNEWVHLDDTSVKQFLKLRDNYEKAFKDVMMNCKKEKSLHFDNIETASFSVLSTLRWLYSWYTKYPGSNVKKLEQEMVKSLIYGLQSK